MLLATIREHRDKKENMNKQEILNRIEKFPLYRKSPRLIAEPPIEKIEIKRPASKATIGRSSLIQIIVTPLAMLAVTLGIGIAMKRGLFMMMGVASTGVTAVFSVYRYISEKKECKRKNQKRDEIYTQYLLNKRKEIFTLRNMEQYAYSYSSPRISDIMEMINSFSSRIYEKSSSDADFMSLTVGYYTGVSSAPISFSYDELAVEKDELEAEAIELVEEYKDIHNKPLVVNLKNSHLGLVGSSAIVHEQIHVLLSKLIVFQSYHDMEIILLINNSDRHEFDYMKWYPHVMVESIGTGGIIDNSAVADQVLLSMHKIIKERELSAKENNKELAYIPHFLFVIDDNRLVADHVIQEYLGKEEKYGFSIIYTSNMQENLPENIGTIIKYEDTDNATLIMNEKKVVNTKFATDRLSDESLEWMARNLSVLAHEQGIVMHLPENVSFFEMYKVNSPAQMDIPGRWQKNATNKSLAVPLGIRVTGEPMMLNLHEKAHGPHGLIAGTTGSGKSEIIQSYILSLAVNFHPYEVAFLLIDYKGGGMAYLFKELPHVLGTITNLDADESMRALVSIKSELSRRQKIFNEYGVNHINAYTSLFKAGEAREPLPHLFIISDEFAELKKEQPEFMTELVSTARLGRSLGIHLILATQKPSGVVTDQIWSNSRFKLALKVQDEADSKEIIKTADAAYIRNPGRAYLQVGNNEIYELFQSAYSGAHCIEETGEEIVDNRVYVRNHLGQMELLNEDLSDSDDNENLKTQLDITVRYIGKLYHEMQCEPVKKPWLEPLPNSMVSPVFQNTIDVKTSEIVDLSVELGYMDIPQQQLQKEYVYNFREDCNLAIFGAPGYGKSTALTTIVLTLARKNSPNLLNMYILDMGNGSLMPLRNIPHVSDYMNLDDGEKLSRFMKYIHNEFKSRKQKLVTEGALNFDMYNRGQSEKLPAIVFIIDNYDVNRDMSEGLDSFVTQMVRDGMSLGIYVVLAASRPGVLRFSLSGIIKSKIALFMYDRTETTSAVGKPEFGIKDVRGRALVKTGEAYDTQIYTVADISNEEIYINTVNERVMEIKEKYSTVKKNKIKTLPSKITEAIFNQILEEEWTEKNNIIPIGLKVDDVSVASIDVSRGRLFVLGSPASGKTTLLKTIIRRIQPDNKIYVIDDKNLELQEETLARGFNYVSSPDTLIAFFEDMRSEIEQRKEAYIIAKEENNLIIPVKFFKNLNPIFVIISELESFINNLRLIKDTSCEEMLLMLEEVNINLIVSAAFNRMRGTDDFTKYMKESSRGIVFGNYNEQNVFTISREHKADSTPGNGFMVENNVVEKVRFTEG